MSRLPREMVRKIKRMDGAEMFDYLRNIYAEGFQDGLREGESEYDDAIIMTEDEARDRLTDEGFLRLIGGQE